MREFYLLQLVKRAERLEFGNVFRLGKRGELVVLCVDSIQLVAALCFLCLQHTH